MITAIPVDEIWPLAEPIIRETCRRLSLPSTYSDYLYDLCSAGRAWLYTCSEAAAFAVVRVRVSDSGEVSMFVCIACNVGATALTPDQGEAYLDELARGMKATVIRFYSERKGFRRMTNWKSDGKTYFRAVREA